MNKVISSLTRIAEFIAATLLAIIFFTFLIQIFTRYAAKIAPSIPIPFISDWMATLQPIGWTVNLISLLWVWVVFFGGAFILRERDHVTFDILYHAVPDKMKRILAALVCIIIISAMIYILPAMWDSVFQNRLMELKKIQTLRVPITGDKIAVKWLFASIILFIIVTNIRYGWRLVHILRGGALEASELDLLTNQEHNEKQVGADQ